MAAANSDGSAVMAAGEGRKRRDGCCRIDESAVMAAAEGTERRDVVSLDPRQLLICVRAWRVGAKGA